MLKTLPYKTGAGGPGGWAVWAAARRGLGSAGKVGGDGRQARPGRKDTAARSGRTAGRDTGKFGRQGRGKDTPVGREARTRRRGREARSGRKERAVRSGAKAGQYGLAAKAGEQFRGKCLGSVGDRQRIAARLLAATLKGGTTVGSITPRSPAPSEPAFRGLSACPPPRAASPRQPERRLHRRNAHLLDQLGPNPRPAGRSAVWGCRRRWLRPGGSGRT